MARFKPTVFDLFRPMVEFRAAALWLTGAAICLALVFVYELRVHWLWVGLSILMATIWLRRGVALAAFRVQLNASRLEFLPIERMRQICEWGQNPRKAPFEFTNGRATTPLWWLGTGFEWQPSHASLALEMLSTDRVASSLMPQWAVRPVWHVQSWWAGQKKQESTVFRSINPLVAALSSALYGNTIANANPIGQPWIHALEPNKLNTLYLESAMAGHTLIVGAPGSGKTRLYEALVTQAIHGKNVVIIFDPKFDVDWERRCRLECQRTGRKYVYFNLAKLGTSARLNPIRNWTYPSEIASRIAGLLKGGKGGDPFVNFAHLSIDRVVKGLLFVGEQPTLKKIQHYIESGVAPLLERALTMVLTDVIGASWRVAIEGAATAMMDADAKGGRRRDGGKGVADPLSAMIKIYQTDARLAHYREGFSNQAQAGIADYDSYLPPAEATLDANPIKRAGEAIAGMVAMHEHSQEHFGKMILTLLPLLEMLCSGEVGEALSPDPLADDSREIWDLMRAINEDAVIYLGLNTLANREVGQAIGSILLAELAACAGNVYNYVVPELRKQVCIFVDEAAEVVNEQFTQILNKARGVNFRVFFATQTLADLEAKMGVKALAEQIQGNANNFICLRVQDMKTRQYMSELFGETRVNERSTSSSMGTESDALALEFRGSVSYTNKRTKGARVHPDLLGRLSNMEFFAMIQGGSLYKVRVPILRD